MSEKNSIATKKRWANVTPEERSNYASKIASIRWSKKTPEEKKEHAMKMVNARKK